MQRKFVNTSRIEAKILLILIWIVFSGSKCVKKQTNMAEGILANSNTASSNKLFDLEIYQHTLTREKKSRFHSFVIPLMYAPPSWGYEVAASLISIGAYHDPSGIDFSIRVSRNPANFNGIFTVSEMAFWTEVKISFIITSRQDIRAGSFIADTSPFLSCQNASKSHIVHTHLHTPWKSSKKFIVVQPYLSGMKTMDQNLRVKFVLSHFEFESYKISIQIRLSNNQAPLELLFISYIIYTLDSEFQVYQVPDINNLPKGKQVFLGINEKDNDFIAIEQNEGSVAKEVNGAEPKKQISLNETKKKIIIELAPLSDEKNQNTKENPQKQLINAKMQSEQVSIQKTVNSNVQHLQISQKIHEQSPNQKQQEKTKEANIQSKEELNLMPKQEKLNKNVQAIPLTKEENLSVKISENPSIRKENQGNKETKKVEQLKTKLNSEEQNPQKQEVNQNLNNEKTQSKNERKQKKKSEMPISNLKKGDKKIKGGQKMAEISQIIAQVKASKLKQNMLGINQEKKVQKLPLQKEDNQKKRKNQIISVEKQQQSTQSDIKAKDVPDPILRSTYERKEFNQVFKVKGLVLDSSAFVNINWRRQSPPTVKQLAEKEEKNECISKSECQTSGGIFYISEINGSQPEFLCAFCEENQDFQATEKRCICKAGLIRKGNKCVKDISSGVIIDIPRSLDPECKNGIFILGVCYEVLSGKEKDFYCQKGEVLKGRRCQCQDNYIRDPVTGRCFLNPCLSNRQTVFRNGKCACIDPLQRIINGKCQTCKYLQIWNEQSQSCQCGENSMKFYGSCSACSANANWVNGLCKCKSGFVGNGLICR